MALISKTQYNNFEPGEFIDEKNRTYEETIALINQFPWEKQRGQPIGLTNASVTIQGDNNNFLKLTLYYHDKFVLYYLDAGNHLYTKDFVHYQDSYPFIQSFFAGSSMDPMDFKPEHLWLHGKAIHFKDQDFRYSVNTSKWWIGILLLGAMILFQIFSTFGFFFSVPDFSRHPAIWAIFSFPAILIILFTLGFCLAIHNYRATRGKILIMSRGKDTFLYGLTDDLKEYKKSDILEMIFYGGQSRRYGMLCYTRLIFKSGIEPDLYFPNSLIKDTDLISKLPEIPHRYTVKFLPPIPSS